MYYIVLKNATHSRSKEIRRLGCRKDVPPYMIDRITMPSWQTWSKVGAVVWCKIEIWIYGYDMI